MHNIFKRNKKQEATPKQLGPPVKISLEQKIIFEGRVESFDIRMDNEGADATCFISFKAEDLIKMISLKEV